LVDGTTGAAGLRGCLAGNMFLVDMYGKECVWVIWHGK